ncbi:hypothetical protein [Planctomycetes bacterium K23_9]|uniref:Uncharacterized protein n=1 Tax=Stieleria marina TaxID=1930275 RepID=A0A517NNQ8_9BACT|nr:hypothetical protein K239x_06750 [Planctomycetes bacterium K23_9]
MVMVIDINEQQSVCRPLPRCCKRLLLGCAVWALSLAFSCHVGYADTQAEPDDASSATPPAAGGANGAPVASAPANTSTPENGAAPGDGVSPSGSSDASDAAEEFVVVQPWDFDPYRVLVWVVSDDPSINAQSIEKPVRSYLDRHYSAIWRLTVADAPVAVASMAARGMEHLTFDSIAASDPVIALKRDHKDAVRIRSSADLKQYVQSIHATRGLIESVKRRGTDVGNETLDGAVQKFSATDGDAIAVQAMWAEVGTEALLLTRGQAMTLENPDAKLIDLPVANLVSTSVDEYDKIFVVSIDGTTTPGKVNVVEFSTLMRYFGKPVREDFLAKSDVAAAIGRGLSVAFSPELRIDDAGLKGARGLLRAGGLILDDESPARVGPGQVLLPMVRKNDRNGRPIMIGPLDWAFLLSTQFKGKIGSIENDKVLLEQGSRDGAATGVVLVVQGKDKAGKPVESRIRIDKVDKESATCLLISGPVPVPGDPFEEDLSVNVRMEFYSGRAGGLQGRQNDRTFRRALLIEPRGSETLVRLHAKGDPDFPLIGYELYEKELYSTKMTFVGRTDWNGRLNVTVTKDPLRLLYVKNGGAVLARLPIVPGYDSHAVADLTGDDMRLQAEAYVNGVANAIVDLVAIRKLLGARIRNRLRKGQLDEAKELLVALRDQPTKDILSGDLEKKQAYFLKEIGSRNANARRKVDNMFSSTREMLDTQITQRDIREIEEDFIRAQSNGGKLPDDPIDPDAVDSSVNEVPVEEPKKK